jgi:putative ABC transport system permease protein
MIWTAYRFIRFEKAKSLGILLAIIISIYLIGLESGLFFYLASLIGGVVNNSNPRYAQVFVINKRSKNANQLAPFDIRWVNQLRSVPGVDGTYGIVMANVNVRFPNGDNSPAMVIGSDYPEMAAGPYPEMLYSGTVQDLLEPGTVSADYYDNRTFHYDINKGTTFEINGKRAKVGATTKNAKGFSTPLLYTTSSKARFFSGFSESLVNGVIVNINNPLEIDAVVERINGLDPDLRAWRAEKLLKATVINVMTVNNMGMSFGTLVLFAIISGFFIIGLTMYSATYDRIKDYGTLKAIGATSSYITNLVITQSFLYSVVGFLASMLLLTFTKYGMD